MFKLTSKRKLHFNAGRSASRGKSKHNALSDRTLCAESVQSNHVTLLMRQCERQDTATVQTMARDSGSVNVSLYARHNARPDSVSSPEVARGDIHCVAE